MIALVIGAPSNTLIPTIPSAWSFPHGVHHTIQFIFNQVKDGNGNNINVNINS